MTDLIDRLKAADGASRELDAEIAIFLAEPTEEELYYKPWTVLDDGPNEGPGCYFVHTRSGRMMRHAPEYTASLDAALALVEDKLPGWEWLITRDGTFSIWTELMKDNRPVEHFEIKHPVRPISACIALLTALKDTEGGEDV